MKFSLATLFATVAMAKNHTPVPALRGDPDGLLGACGTSGGSGCVPCANSPSYCCSNCGPQPCCGSDGSCWSCAGADGMCYPYLCANGNQCGTGPCDMLGTKFIAKATDAELASSKFESFFDHTHEMAHVSQKIEDVAASVEEFVEELIGTPCQTGSACNGDTCAKITMNGVTSCCFGSIMSCSISYHGHECTCN